MRILAGGGLTFGGGGLLQTLSTNDTLELLHQPVMELLIHPSLTYGNDGNGAEKLAAPFYLPCVVDMEQLTIQLVLCVSRLEQTTQLRLSGCQPFLARKYYGLDNQVQIQLLQHALAYQCWPTGEFSSEAAPKSI